MQVAAAAVGVSLRHAPRFLPSRLLSNFSRCPPSLIEAALCSVMEGSQSSKRRRSAAASADEGTCAMSMGGLPWTQLGSAGDASELGREVGSGEGGIPLAGAASLAAAAPLAAASPALYEVLTRLLLVAERARAFACSS